MLPLPRRYMEWIIGTLRWFHSGLEGRAMRPRTRDLIAEMSAAVGTRTEGDTEELAQHGVPLWAVCLWQLVGVARISRVVDADVYEPDPRSGAWVFLTPVLVQDPANPESQSPEAYVRLGSIIDIVAWDPQTPRRWARRAGLADWLGLVEPQYLDPEPTRIWRSVLNWFRADCSGLVVLNQNPIATYSLLMGFQGGIDAEDPAHAAELKRALERPWPIPRIGVGRPPSRLAPDA